MVWQNTVQGTSLIVFWVLFGLTWVIALSAMVISILSVKRDRERITLIQKDEISGSLNVKQDVTAEEKLTSTSDLQIKHHANVGQNVTLTDGHTQITNEIRLSGVVLNQGLAQQLVQKTQWLQVTARFDHTLTVPVRDNLKTPSAFYPMNQPASLQVTQGTDPQLFQVKTLDSDSLASWLKLPDGYWSILAEVTAESDAGSSNNLRQLTLNIVAYADSLEKWTLKDASPTTSTSVGQFVGPTSTLEVWGLAEASDTFPVSGRITPSSASRIGVQIEAAATGTASSLKIAELKLTAFRWV